MKKYRNGRLVDMTPAEIEKREAHVVLSLERRGAREALELEQARRERVLNELIDAHLKR